MPSTHGRTHFFRACVHTNFSRVYMHARASTLLPTNLAEGCSLGLLMNLTVMDMHPSGRFSSSFLHAPCMVKRTRKRYQPHKRTVWGWLPARLFRAQCLDVLRRGGEHRAWQRAHARTGKRPSQASATHPFFAVSDSPRCLFKTLLGGSGTLKSSGSL